LTAVVCALLQNCRGFDAIGQWLREVPLDFCWTLGFTRRPPTASGLRKLLGRIDVVAFEQALTRWITDVLDNAVLPDDLRETPLDGKTLRGTWDRLGRAVHLLTVLDGRTKCVLHQRSIGDSNEHKTALLVLNELVLKGRVITADAAFCHADVCQTIVEGGGHYVLPVKDNQPQLRAAIESEFAAENAAFSPLRSAPT
jgi:hypothetical protein